MGRSSRDKNEDEHNRGILRQLRSENKQLKRTVARLQKQLLKLPIETIEAEEAPIDTRTVNNHPTCPKCTKDLQIIDLGVKTVLSCSSCSYRVAVKGRTAKG